VLFGTFLRFAPKNSRNKRFSDVFTQRINVVRLTTETVFVSYLFLVDSIPGLPKTTSNQEAVFESPHTQIHYWRTQQWKNTSMTIITDYGMNCKEIITSLVWCWTKKIPSLSECGAGSICSNEYQHRGFTSIYHFSFVHWFIQYRPA